LVFYLLMSFLEKEAVSSLLIEYLNESNYHIALYGAIGDFCLRQNLFK